MADPFSWASAGAASAGAASSSAAAAGAAAAATANAAATATGVTATTTATTAASLASYASIAASLASAGLAIAGSSRNAALQRAQAGQQELQARQELIRGQQQSNELRDRLLRTLAAQNARFAAAGISIDSGTPMTLAEEAQRQANVELGLVSGNSASRSAQAMMQAGLLSEAADFTQAGGLVSGGINLLDTYDRWQRRQPGTVR